ncbi:MAG: sulfurtransferase [Bacteroidetes bacterium]|nr:MAG: sulfurtransferase [Bacteroidota bacterium]PTM09437.1 MAG: sulfurtransferase [Bacteroidota bacterium]
MTPTYQTIIAAAELHDHLHQANWLVIDCRADLSDLEAGRRAYAQGHVPGAWYAHLEEDLSGPIVPGKTGRHPLPSVAAMEALFGRWGISPTTQVVVYDDSRGAIAARLWWMLRYLGHTNVAVLDGGYAQWLAGDYPVDTTVKPVTPTAFMGQVQTDWLRSVAAVDAQRQDADFRVVDSRATDRYRGEVEPIDPVAGHIPGAINLPFADNWLPNGLLRPAAELQARFAELPPAPHTTFYCGSGVTACHNILAYAHAGLGDAGLYAGSWSEWIVDAKRPVAVGG